MSCKADGAELTPDEIRELRRMAKNSARESGLGLVLLPRDIDALKDRDRASIDAILTAAVMRFCGIESDGGDFTDGDKATLRHIAEAQDAYAKAWIAERKRRRLPFVPLRPNTAPRVIFSQAGRNGKKRAK